MYINIKKERMYQKKYNIICYYKKEEKSHFRLF